MKLQGKEPASNGRSPNNRSGQNGPPLAGLLKRAHQQRPTNSAPPVPTSIPQMRELSSPSGDSQSKLRLRIAKRHFLSDELTGSVNCYSNSHSLGFTEKRLGATNCFCYRPPRPLSAPALARSMPHLFRQTRQTQGFKGTPNGFGGSVRGPSWTGLGHH
jgi:hypothetical protein